MQGTESSTTLRGCRVVTTSMTARLLLSHQLRELDEISWSVVTGDLFEDPPKEVSVDVVPIRRELSWSDAHALFRLWRHFLRQKFDFVQTHTQKASLLGLPAARLSRTTAIYTIHGAMYFRDNGAIANVLGWIFEKWCCTWAHRVLVQSREDQQVLPKARICRADKIRYVGNGISLERFLQPDTDGLAPGRPVVLMVSRLVKEKGCADFIEVAGALRDRAEFVHVGPVELDQSDAISNAEMEAAAAVVTFVGAVEDIRPYLAAADLVVQPSYREGIPRVVMEAAAAGKPVVGYDVRGVREVVDHSTGLLVRRGDRQALIRTVRGLLADPERRAELGRACRSRIVEMYSEDDVVGRLRTLYSEMSRGA